MRMGVLALVGALLMMNGCKATDAARTTETATPSALAAPRNATTRAASDSSAADDSASTSARDARPLIVCFGDSLTAGYGVDPDESYPSHLQAELDSAGYKYRVVNMGISGETTKDGLARVDRVIATHPAIAVVEFGGNDGLRGIPISAYQANLYAIVGKLQTAGIQVALAGITLPPQFSGPYIQQFNAAFHTIAAKRKVPLYPFLLKNVYGVQGSIQPDGVHPTAQGCQQVAKNIAGFLEPLLKK